MRLLVVTQVVDQNDPFLGFFTEWLAEFAERFEHIHVICLKEGVHSLPLNVSIHSLGKEKGLSRPQYVARFFRYLWTLRSEYEAVFVHMNQEYVLLGGIIWKLLRKRIYLWRNHYTGGVLTDIAAALSSKVFCTSRFSYTAKYRKTSFMPVGIPIAHFSRASVDRQPRSILFLARLAPSKHPDVLLDALKELESEGIDFSASFYGSALPIDARFRERLVKDAGAMGEKVRFFEGIPYRETPAIFHAHDIFVDLGKSGMYNKTIFEAAACGCIVIAASKDFAEHVDARHVFSGGAEDLAIKLKGLIAMSEEEKEATRKKMRDLVESQSLEKLSARLFEGMKE